jgi:hypothetical protein
LLTGKTKTTSIAIIAIVAALAVLGVVVVTVKLLFHNKRQKPLVAHHLEVTMLSTLQRDDASISSSRRESTYTRTVT